MAAALPTTGRSDGKSRSAISDCAMTAEKEPDSIEGAQVERDRPTKPDVEGAPEGAAAADGSPPESGQLKPEGVRKDPRGVPQSPERSEGSGSDRQRRLSSQEELEPYNPESLPEDKRGPLTGHILEQRYRIKEKLGEGGMGVVYRAEHTLMRKEMAVKVLLPQFGNFEGITRRFHREAQSASRLDHPGIIHINDFGETAQGVLFIAMELLAGRSLTEIIRDESPMSVKRAVRIVLQLCLALDHAHAQGIVHRDLKPDNVMIAVKGETDDIVKVLDFGIAKITQGDGSAEALTEAGLVFGTPEYLAPEQAAGQEVDHRADLYAMGVIFYEMLAGARPFVAPTKLELLGMHIHEKPTSLRKARPDLDIPAELDWVVLKILEKRPEDRFQNAAEVFEAISSIESIASEPLPLWPANTLTFTAQTGVRRFPPARSRKRFVVMGAIGGGLVATLATVLVLAFAGRNGDGQSGGSGKGDMSSMALSTSRATNEEIQGVQTLLASGNYTEAQKQLEHLADQHPTDPRVHLLNGQIHFLKGDVMRSLGYLRESVRLDPEMKSNELLLTHLKEILGWTKGAGHGWKMRREAMDFVERYLDEGAADMLKRYVNEWWEHDLVWRAIAVLLKHGVADGVDYVHAYDLAFRGERSCDKRKDYLKDIQKRQDPRFLPLLRDIVASNIFRVKHTKLVVDNRCIRSEAQAVIMALEVFEEPRPSPGPDAGVGSDPMDAMDAKDAKSGMTTKSGMGTVPPRRRTYSPRTRPRPRPRPRPIPRRPRR